MSDLILDARRLAKLGNLAIARTISGEVVVSEGFVELFQTNKLRGAEFRVVKKRKNPSLAVPGWSQPLINSPPLEIIPPTRAGESLFDDGSERHSNNAAILDELGFEGSWCDREGQYRCPLGHTIGLNLLSELAVEKNGFRGWDIARTQQRVGVRRGLLRPDALLVVSPRLRQLVLDHELKGMGFEIVHLMPSEPD